MLTATGPATPRTGDPLANGLPLVFTTSIDGKSGLDSIRISPQGGVELHKSGETDAMSGKFITAFNNSNPGTGSLQGEWDVLPSYDFFYWGRTIYQGRLAFVVTWVKIPTLDNGTPIDATPTTVQLMLVSDASPSSLEDYFTSPNERISSSVDIIWNFDSIQSQNAAPSLSIVTIENQNPFYSGLVTIGDEYEYTPLISDLFISGDQTATVGLGGETCSAACVIDRLLNNRLQSPVNGRYVLGYRD